MCCMTLLPTTASKEPSANGRSVAAAWTKVAFGFRRDRYLHHCGRNVDARRLRAACHRISRCVTGTGAHVEDTRALADMRRVEQGVDRLGS